MDKQRFVFAIVLSAAILFGWSLLFPVKRQPQQQSNANSNTSTAEQKTDSPAPSPEATADNKDKAADANIPPDSAQPKTFIVKTPLYKATLDNRGAVATSWIIIKNKDNDRPLHSVNKEKPELELINPDRVKLGESPLRLQIASIDKNDERNLLLDNRLYTVVELDNGNEKEVQGDIDFTTGSRTLKFSMTVEYGPDNNRTKLDVSKTITFYADHYSADIKVDFKQNDKTEPIHLLIGPSIGDQGITQYTFYSIPPEGVAAVGEGVARHNALTINHKSSDREPVGGQVDWAGVGDTYFAMVAVPSQKTEGLEYRTTMIEHPVVVNGQQGKEARYLITAYVPIPVNGFLRLYVGPKDHYLLQGASANVSEVVKRQVDLEGLIDYGFLSWMSRPLAVPILWSIKFLYNITGSYGIAIILFTIVIYSLFFPLKWRSSRAMKKAQKLAPRMKELQEKIKGMKKTDPRLRELQMEQMRLMKEGNPLGGCLPLLIQMPFLFALYRAITISIDFRQARFLWIPDLSAAEPTSIHILPILMAGSMMVLQLITPAPSADPMQRKLMAIGMPLLMLWMLWSAPAGLLVYWLVGNLVGFGQQFLINRLTKTEDDQQPPSGKTSDARSTKKLKASVSQA